MAPRPVFSEVRKYREVEGGLFGASAALVAIACLIMFFVALYHACCRSSDKYKKSGRKYETLRRYVHSTLMLIFPELITRSVCTQKDGKQDEHMPNEVYLFADKEFEFIEECQHSNNGVGQSQPTRQPQPPAEVTGQSDPVKECSLSCCLHFYTYLYFVVVGVLAALWLIVITIENAIYRKTGTCNDIDVLENSYTCFNLGDDSVQIDCKDGSSADIDVFCYLYGLSPGAVGIGFSIFKLITFVVTIYFRIVIKIAEKTNIEQGKAEDVSTPAADKTCIPTCCKPTCLHGLMFTVQLIVFVGAVVAIPAVSFPLQYKHKLMVYFFHGDAVMRWVMFVVLYVTIPFVIMVPWCGFTSKQAYRNMVSDPNQNTKQN